MMMDSSSEGRRSPSRQRSARFDVTKSMDRLRSSMVGGVSVTAQTTEDLTINDENICRKIPAILLIALFHLMIGIPFGVSYFPVGWKSDDQIDLDTESDDNLGVFPLPAKEALGIRMFLLSTVIGQIVFTLWSGFDCPVGLQMVENVPFCHELVRIAIRYQGASLQALATSFAMFGISTLCVGLVFWGLGFFRLGNVVSYFPNHILIGAIGGIGLYIVRTGLEVTVNDSWDHTIQYPHLVIVVVFFELVLRLLERFTSDTNGQPQFALLTPVYFCLLTPVFYLGLAILGVSLESAAEQGYFFPPLSGEDDNLYNIWTSVDYTLVSWAAIKESVPTMVALVLFSLIHVPINIPALAISTRCEVDMNVELEAHGYANILASMAGAGGGLPNYMAYTQSVLYSKSGGSGRLSGMLVAVVTACLFILGPTIASYIPRTMAGTLLVHVGFDLFLEGVYDSYGRFDWLEYSGIWLITIIMTMYGMEAAMIAGVVTALSTYAVQNTTYVHPLRGSMTASTLRSSHWNRSTRANDLLASGTSGRRRILVVQLQGHLFFGNAVLLTQAVRDSAGENPLVIILDFGLVLGIDSSASQSIGKLKNLLHHEFGVGACIFVTGSSEGFPTEYPLTEELTKHARQSGDVESGLGLHSENSLLVTNPYMGGFVMETLDDALKFAEDVLIAREDLSLLEDDRHVGDPLVYGRSLKDERQVALKYLTMLCPKQVDPDLVGLLFGQFKREVHLPEEYVWRQGSQSDSAKLLVRGSLLAKLENEAGTEEVVMAGNTIGELGLVEGIPRMSSVSVISSEPAILYSLNRSSFERLLRETPEAARLLDLILIRYLSARVQHVSNRIFETRCLPI